jgi:hypothetical protein
MSGRPGGHWPRWEATGVPPARKKPWNMSNPCLCAGWPQMTTDSQIARQILTGQRQTPCVCHSLLKRERSIQWWLVYASRSQDVRSNLSTYRATALRWTTDSDGVTSIQTTHLLHSRLKAVSIFQLCRLYILYFPSFLPTVKDDRHSMIPAQTGLSAP